MTSEWWLMIKLNNNFSRIWVLLKMFLKPSIDIELGANSWKSLTSPITPWRAATGKVVRFCKSCTISVYVVILPKYFKFTNEKKRIAEVECCYSHIYCKYWLFNSRAWPIFGPPSGLQICTSSAYILALNDVKNFRMKKTTSTPLMMENPVKSPIVPPMRLICASNLSLWSLSILSKVAVSK